MSAKRCLNNIRLDKDTVGEYFNRGNVKMDYASAKFTEFENIKIT